MYDVRAFACVNLEQLKKSGTFFKRIYIAPESGDLNRPYALASEHLKKRAVTSRRNYSLKLVFRQAGSQIIDISLGASPDRFSHYIEHFFASSHTYIITRISCPTAS